MKACSAFTYSSDVHQQCVACHACFKLRFTPKQKTKKNLAGSISFAYLPLPQITENHFFAALKFIQCIVLCKCNLHFHNSNYLYLTVSHTLYNISLYIYLSCTCEFISFLFFTLSMFNSKNDIIAVPVCVL